MGDNQSGTDADPYLNDFDNDGYNDTIDILPRVASPGDLDADKCMDEVDAFEDNPLECLDTDGDGIGNEADTDDDNDGWSDIKELEEGTNPLLSDTDGDDREDTDDEFPNDISEWKDTDGDGVGDNSDSHPGVKYFQNNLQFVLAVSVGIIVLAVFGYLGVIILRRKPEDNSEQPSEEKEVIEVDYPHEGMTQPSDELEIDSSINDSVNDDSDQEVSEEKEEIRDTSHIDALLNELPTPPKPQIISPPEGTPVNEYGQRVWADDTGQVWCVNSDGSILRHDAATGGWIQFHN